MRIPAWTGLALLLFWMLLHGGIRFYVLWSEGKIEQQSVQKVYSLPEESLFLFAITRKDSASMFNWEHDREFSYQNQMFDVVRRESRGDSLFLWCYWDEAESELKQLAHSLFCPKSNSSTGTLQDLLAWTLLQPQLPASPPDLGLKSRDKPQRTLWTSPPGISYEYLAPHFHPPELSPFS